MHTASHVVLSNGHVHSVFGVVLYVYIGNTHKAYSTNMVRDRVRISTGKLWGVLSVYPESKSMPQSFVTTYQILCFQ